MALRALADDVADDPVEVMVPGGWGPWVNGGAWLTIQGQRVDWIYRDLQRVHEVWRGKAGVGHYTKDRCAKLTPPRSVIPRNGRVAGWGGVRMKR